MIVDNNQKWRAIADNCEDYDGAFFYAVKSTHIFCRPSCKSRTPLRENVEFFDTAAEAMNAGYRPCKRCRPDLIIYRPVSEPAEKAKDIIDALFFNTEALSKKLVQIGVSRRHLTEIFVNRYGCTPKEYLDSRRLEAARQQLNDRSASIVDVALSIGFESLSSFYALFKKHTGMTPGEYRRVASAGTAGNYFTYDLALGKISVAADKDSITAVKFTDVLENSGQRRSSSLTDLAAQQLEEFFSGRRKSFDLPINPGGTPFQQRVWKALGQIDYGHTKSYKQVAQMVDNPNASRAVGMANNKNPVLVIIPCHRVVGAKGELVGYAASLEIKKQLLELEQKIEGRI